MKESGRYKRKSDNELRKICKNQCDTKNITDELLHYFAKCEFFQPILEAHLQTTLEYLEVTATRSREISFNYDVVIRYPSDRGFSRTTHQRTYQLQNNKNATDNSTSNDTAHNTYIHQG